MKKLVFLLFLALIFTSCEKRKELKVFQINLWHEGNVVSGGFDAIVNEIDRLDPDVVLFSEVNNKDGEMFIPRVLAALKEKNKTYYGENGVEDVAVISKYPILDERANYPKDSKAGSVAKVHIQVAGKIVTIYSAHLDYTNYACFLPRGYSGTTWKKIEAPIIDADSVLRANRLSLRDEAIQGILDDAKEELAKGNIIILGGDFNEPSHLDWGEDTKNMFDHNGVVVNWDCSVMLNKGGFKDAFREKYPNPITHPGFTFPSDNTDVDVNKLAWAPEADERDRIDFIYYVPTKNIELKDIVIVGPSETILKGERSKNNSQDIFMNPIGTWPTDHKALLATFIIKVL